MKRIMLFLILLLPLSVTASAIDPGDQTSPDPTDHEDAEVTQWGAVGDLSKPSSLGGSLLGASKVDPTRWQASLYPKSDVDRCSATLIGPEVVMTAAHCVNDGTVIHFSKGDSPYSAVCQRAPAYAAQGAQRDRTADFALCKVSPAVRNIRYERINTDQTIIVDALPVLLTGFGCTMANGSGGNDGYYRAGPSAISRAPGVAKNLFLTKGQAAVCFGDSGAGAYLQGPGQKRVLIGINAVAAPEQGTELGQVSRLSSVSSPAAVAFLAYWSSRNGDPKICRSTTPSNDAECHI